MHKSLLFSAVFLLAALAVQAKELASKSIHREFHVEKNAALEISNFYGDVVYTTEPNREVITVDIEVELYHRNEDQAQKQLDKINIIFDENGQNPKIRTQIDGKNNNFKDLQISYKVRVPRSLKLTLVNKYGDVVINELHNSTTVKVAYGSIKIDKLLSANNEIKVMYGDLNLNYANQLKLDADYSDVVIDQVTDFSVDAMYSDMRVQLSEKSKIKTMYGDVVIEKVNDITIDGMYSEIRMDNVVNSMVVKTMYGDVNVKKVHKQFTDVEVDGMYSDMVLSFESGSVFTLSSDLMYADISLPSGAQIINKNKTGASYTLEAEKGKSQKPSKVKVISRYGDVKIN